jgi:heme/copper-type cytochrome/quinol oxidase subunit 3
MEAGVASRDRPAGPASVRDLERFRLRPRGAEATAHVGMAVFLGSWAMLFAGLFLAYAFVRARAGSAGSCTSRR